MLNWKVRFKNRSWVAAFISQLILIAQIILSGLNTLGITDFQITQNVKDYIVTLADAVFILLSLLGLVQDPTTKGFADSENALKYKEPK